MTQLAFAPFQPSLAGQTGAENKAPERYSTNPHTIRARLRKMSLTGAQKVEEAGKTADYKALRHARKVLEADPEYLAASGTARGAMLKRRMRDTMEKRRMKGQDTRSKLAAFHAQDPRALRAGTTSSTTRAAIPQFLEEDGWIPARATRKTMTSENATPFGDNKQLISPNTVPCAHMEGLTRSPLSGVDSTATGDGLTLPSLDFLKDSYSHIGGDARPLTSFETFRKMTPEHIQSNGVDSCHQTHASRSQLSSLRNMGDDVSNDSDALHGRALSELGAHLGAEKSQIAKLGERLLYLEKVVHAMQNVLFPNMEDRMAKIEGGLEELNAKVGDGCEAEVAKMREVFGSMRQAMANVGNFL